MASNNPFEGGNPTLLVDKFLGSAYPVIKHVAQNTDYIKHVSYHMELLFNIFSKTETFDEILINLPKINSVFNSLYTIAGVYNQLDHINDLHTALNDLLTLKYNIPNLVTIRSDVQEYATAAYNSAQAAAQSAIDAANAASGGTDFVRNRANHTGEQAISTITGLIDALDHKLSDTSLGTTVATLTNGVLTESQIPAIAISDTYEVNSQAAMLALVAQRGDIAVRSEINKSFILKTNDPTQLVNWVELRTPTDAVLSVAGKTGAITLTTDDINHGVATKRYTTVEQTKLAGIADGATANESNAVLKNRANHTGTQSLSTIASEKLDANALLSRTPADRFADVIDLDDWLLGDGVTFQDANIAKLLTYMSANPTKIYRSHKSRRYLFKTPFTIPNNLKLEMNGAEFVFSNSYNANAPVLTVGSGVNFDTLTLCIAATYVDGNGVVQSTNTVIRQCIYLMGNNRGGTLSLYSEGQLKNDQNSDSYGIQLRGSNILIDVIKIKNIDMGGRTYHDTAPLTNIYIGFIDVESYALGFNFGRVTGGVIGGYNIRVKSPNALPNPGRNSLGFGSNKDISVGPGLCKDAAEHGIRIGGVADGFGQNENMSFNQPTIINAGQTGFKAFTGDNAKIISNLSIIGAHIIDSGSAGFNYFGMMLQGIKDCQVIGAKITNKDKAYCGLDGIYASQIENLRLADCSVRNAKRNGLRLSHDNGDQNVYALDMNAVFVTDFVCYSSLESGIYIDADGSVGRAADNTAVPPVAYVPPAQPIIRDIYIDALLIGGTYGITWYGNAGNAYQPCSFMLRGRGQSQKMFNVPDHANLIYFDMDNIKPNVSITVKGTGKEVIRRFPDGTQIATLNAKATYSSQYVLSYSWAFSKPFIDGDYSVNAQMSLRSPDNVQEGETAKIAYCTAQLTSGDANTQNINVVPIPITGNNTSFQSGQFIWLDLIAIGRWRYYDD